MLSISLNGFLDPESDTDDFYLQLYQGDDCNEGDIGLDHFVAMSSEIDVRNETLITLYEFQFLEGWFIAYVYQLQVLVVFKQTS